MALQRMPFPTKSVATDFVSPMTAAFVTPYAQRSGTPVMEPATDDMLMIEPARASTIAGRNARIMWYMEFTLRSNAAFHVARSISSTVPFGTVPAQLNTTSTLPTDLASDSIAPTSRTSSTWVSHPARDFSACASMSTPTTRAPARANASALARPMPDAAAETIAVLPASLSDSIDSPCGSGKNLLALRGAEPRQQGVRRRAPVLVTAHELADRPVAAPHHAPGS